MYKTLSIFILILTNVGIVSAQDEPTSDDIRQAVMDANDAIEISVAFSLDGIYQSTVEQYPCTTIDDTEVEYALETLTITEISSEALVWETEQVISCGGLGTNGFDQLRWIDSRLYFTQGREGSAHGGGFFPFVEPVYYYDVAESVDDATRIGSAVFSARGDYIASWEASTVSIIATEDNSTFTTSLLTADFLITDVIWLPDQSGVMVVQTDDMMNPQASIVTLINVEQEQDATIIIDTRN